MGTDLNAAPPYQGPQDVSYTSVEEAMGGEGPEGQSAPPGTTPVAVTPGDTISELMAAAHPPMDWGNPAHREQFLRDNPQFADLEGGRNPDLIWPGEVIYLRTASPAQATDQAIAELAALEEQYGDTTPGSSVRAAEHRAEMLAQGEQAVKDAALAELASGATANEIIERHGGINVSPRVEAAVREAATDHAAQQLVQAQQSGDTTAIAQAQANLEQAITEEIRADAYELAVPVNGQVNREAHGKGAVTAGDVISTRLEEMGLTDQAAKIQELAGAVQTGINNEV